MAYSYQEFTGDGTTQTFTIPFNYTEQTEISVFVAGSELTSSDFSFLTSNTISINTAPANGANVRIGRSTDLTNRAVDFVDGAVLTEEDLDTAMIQVFHGAQEAIDTAKSAVAPDSDGALEAQNRRIKNVAAPVQSTDAANKQWVLDATATQVADANAAKAAAEAAETAAAASETAAASSASQAASSVTTAAGHATTAEGHKNQAGTYKTQTEALLQAAQIPTSLTNKAKQFLQVMANEQGYELVSSVAAPNFFGFKTLADNSIEMTYGRDADYNSEEYEGWIMAENVTFSVTNNNLVVNL